MSPTVTLGHLHHFIHRRASMRSLGKTLVYQALDTIIFVTIDLSSKCALADSKQPRSLLLRQSTLLPTSIRFLKPHYPHLL
jgi:hypothetical protein